MYLMFNLKTEISVYLTTFVFLRMVNYYPFAIILIHYLM